MKGVALLVTLWLCVGTPPAVAGETPRAAQSEDSRRGGWPVVVGVLSGLGVGFLVGTQFVGDDSGWSGDNIVTLAAFAAGGAAVGYAIGHAFTESDAELATRDAQARFQAETGTALAAKRGSSASLDAGSPRQRPLSPGDRRR